MEITEKNIKKWSTIGARPTLGQILLDLAEKDKKIIVLTADVSTSAGLDRFRKKYPEQYIDVGIAEQNMMGIATGLASNGFHAITVTFAPFQTMRCLEQIRTYQGYMNEPLVMIGLASGIYHSYLGNTHCSIEDIGVLRSIPNLSIECPADCVELVKALESAVYNRQATYIRMPEGTPLPSIYEKDFEFSIGKANILKEGKDIAIIANGRCVDTALKVAAKIKEKNILSTVIDFHTIKPIDTVCLDNISNLKNIVTIEEHNIIGGLYSSISEYYMRKKNKPQIFAFGINDFYPHATDYKTALEQCCLTSEQITDNILGNL